MTLSIKALLLALGALAAAMLPPDTAAACGLRFAWAAWEPFHYRDEDGRMQGVDHALVEEAARRIGCTLAWDEVPRSRGQELLREGRVDGVAGVARTAEREAFAHFSRRLRPGTNVLFIAKGTAAQFPFGSLEELARSPFRLGVVLGARYSQDYERLVVDGALDDNLVAVGASDQALQMMIRGRLDGFIDGRTVGRRMIRDAGLAHAVDEHPMPITGHEAYVMFSKRSVAPDLVRKFDEALTAMEAEGVTARILEDDIR